MPHDVMDFDITLSTEQETLIVEASSPLGEDYATSELPRREELALDSRSVGKLLFLRLFPGAIQTLYQRCRGRLASSGRLRLRIRAHVRASAMELVRIHSIPWELVHDPHDDGFLALDPQIQLVRYLSLPAPVPDSIQASGGRLEVLIATAAPSEATPISGDEECTAIERALAESSIGVTVLRGVTRGRLLESLGTQRYDVLHFIGHGNGPSDTRMGGILLENETGGADWVTARDLALITSVTTSLRLVFLNSCSTAALAARSHMHLAASVGPSLALCGVPAVVGMVSAIGDRVAVTFANSVYTRLRDGATLEAAVHAARIAMRLDPINGESWTIPVVFSRMTQGQATARPAPERPTVTDNPVNHSALASPSYDIKAKFGIMRVKNLAVGHHGRDAPVGGSAEQVRIDFDAGETEADNVTIGGIGSGPGNTRS